MKQPNIESGSLSDPDGSIFLRENGQEVVETIPTLESLKQAFLRLKDWERAEGILDAIELHYPEAVRTTYGHLQLALLIERGGVEKTQDDSELLLIVEIRNYLYKLVSSRRMLGALALTSPV
ncbi:hypothetical protein H7Y40_01075 [Pedobacter sp.]|nr:hypothetical protein [Candidatus Saccharibacteria bacterium]